MKRKKENNKWSVPIFIIGLFLTSALAVTAIQTIKLEIPRSEDGQSSILTWGESGTYLYTLSGVDSIEAMQCTTNSTDCKWSLELIVNGLASWNGPLIKKVSTQGVNNHVNYKVTDKGDGIVEIEFTATPPSNGFVSERDSENDASISRASGNRQRQAVAPFKTSKWHGIEYQVWRLSAIINRGTVLQVGGSTSLVVIESMDKIKEFLSDETKPTLNNVDHLNYKLNNEETGALYLSKKVRDMACENETYKEGWDSFKNEELKAAIDDLEELDAKRIQQLANYGDFSVEDALDLEKLIGNAVKSYNNAKNIYINQFNSCPCLGGCTN